MKYFVYQIHSRALFPYCVGYGERTVPLDKYRTRRAADFACQQLNAGVAFVNPHRVTGCRVEAR